MFNSNYLKVKLDRGEKVLGTWCVISSTHVVDVIASSGIDFLIIDAEHGPVSFSDAQTMVMAAEAHQVTPIMRIGEINEWNILRAMDLGIHGLQLPNITCREDAEKFVTYAKYPPIGVRGFSPYTKAAQYDVKNGTKLSATANANTLLIANVEGVEGLKNLDEISKVEHIDVIFIGLFDLSKSLGIPGEVEHPQVMSSLRHAIDVITSNGKKVGAIASSVAMLNTLKELDIAYLTYSVDTGMLKESYQNIVHQFRAG